MRMMKQRMKIIYLDEIPNLQHDNVESEIPDMINDFAESEQISEDPCDNCELYVECDWWLICTGDCADCERYAQQGGMQ